MINPCSPSPCGSGAVCREVHNSASCTCIFEYYGDPFLECKPECVQNSDCPANKGCVQNKCRDVCPGVCGTSALCEVVNHVPMCSCPPNYEGNPFVHCTPIPPTPARKESEEPFFTSVFCLVKFNKLFDVFLRAAPVRRDPCYPNPCVSYVLVNITPRTSGLSRILN